MLKSGKDLFTVQELAIVLHRFTNLHTLILESMPNDDNYRELEMVLRTVLHKWNPSTETRNLKLEFSGFAQRHPNRFLRGMHDIGDIVEECCSGTFGRTVSRSLIP